MTNLEKIITNLKEDLNKLLVLAEYNLSDPEVIKKSQELDKYVTAFYHQKKVPKRQVI